MTEEDRDDSCRIRVIGAGLGRTGTKSLAAALDMLGYRTYHFPLPEHSAAWAAYAKGTGSAQDAIGTAVAAGYNATCDQPMADALQEQLEMFPDAKVVLTVRDSPEKWAASWKILMEFIRVQEQPFSLWRPFYPTFIQWIPFMQNWKRMRDIMGVHLGLLPGQLIRGHVSEPAGWLEKQYDAHNKTVRKVVPKEKLLVFNVKEGWAPLCKFLGKELPEEPFPNVNESKELRRATTIMKVVSYGWLPFLGSMGYISTIAIKSIFRKPK
mmetsp:Transcript_5358/g.9101  ORF Transcript_5358/g.9101 Transcript_5358/m.9101 type:complete len:267 (-) Transcript_5358:43-843(-)|eukprot:CAMPEP_0197725980 /NCGR_PEP_ID=MMETSP1434-20131217/12383_1 /TAXON_ID=265543 /ORGANISM="Minutocellus polymorphus, Strain CCMP3303" /LENGTH=266 /DNA_ID=CAMNT_0043311743 /DNA_START=38 /DNA_END=838 /DNA_ORIENTATION=-